jgi:Na+/H+ antiporter NhaA/protein-disulfide isomerase
VSAVLGERTAWTRNLAAPLRAFVQAETASAVLLGVAAAAAVVWATVDLASYERIWTTVLSIRLGGHELALTLRGWVNSGLMTFFFFVVGLEARRELDVGELRDRRRLALPLAVGGLGVVVPIGIYLAFNVGHRGAHAWGAAMSTDTAIALGVLALLGKRVPDRLRAFTVTVLVVDDLISLSAIAFGYSSGAKAVPLLIAAALFALVVLLVRIGVHTGVAYLLLGIATWVAVYEGGVEPIVVGLAFGLLTYAGPARSSDLQRATDLFRLFREQPTPEYASAARRGVRLATSPNDRLQAMYLPWTSYAIVPLFALANAGIRLSGPAIRDAARSRVALGIVVGYLVGKPVAVSAATAVVSRIAPRMRPAVGWLSVLTGGAAASAAFTVSLLVATIALSDGEDLRAAKLAVLVCAGAAPGLAAATVWSRRFLSVDRRLRAVLGRAESIVDLAVPVDPERDHVRGPATATVTLVEYGDFECPYCGRAESSITELLGTDVGVQYVWRHLPLTDVHPHTQLAAEASEAAAAQGKFWEMHDVLLARQEHLEPDDLVGYAEEIGLDVDRFVDDLRRHAGGSRISDDVESAELSGVAGTPTFFVNGRRHWGAYDAAGLTRAVREARARARAAAPVSSP